MSDVLKSLWDLTTAEYRALAPTWRANERRFYGGPDVSDDLLSFRFETDAAAGAAAGAGERAATVRAMQSGALAEARVARTLDGYESRKSLAIWSDLMRVATEKFGGALMQHFPKADGDGIDFGTLGDAQEDGSAAALLWTDADGVGNDARSLPAFWADELQAAMATGYRYVFTEGPAEPPANQAEWAEGRRPYWIGLSPLQVPLVEYDRGRIVLAVWHAAEGGLRMEDGELTNEPVPYLYLMVAKGFEGLGPAFSGGGWWHVDEDGEVMTRADGTERRGTWRSGEIPLRRLYGRRGSKSAQHRADGGQTGGLTQLGKVSALRMNIDSLAFYDLFTSHKRTRIITGLSKAAAIHATQALRDGDPYVFAPDTDADGRSGQTNVYDSGAVSANQSAVAEREILMTTAREVLMREIVTSPDASGRAQEMKFSEGNAPLLVGLAENLEECVTGALRDMETRWMGTARPTASLTMPRRFTLLSVAQALRPVIEGLVSANLSAPSVFEKWVLAAMEEAGQIPADKAEAEAFIARVRAELYAGYERDRAFITAAGGDLPGGDGAGGDVDADLAERLREADAVPGQEAGGA